MDKIDLIPSACQAVRLTLESASVSSQERILPVRTHSPANPESTLTGVPMSGVPPPLVARQAIHPLFRNAIAAPVAPVTVRTLSATSCNAFPKSSGWVRSSQPSEWLRCPLPDICLLLGDAS